MEDAPSADIIEVLGLLELIHDYRNSMPVDEIHNFTGMEFDELQPVIEAAEQLGLIKIKGQLVSLTRDGLELLKKQPHERKALLAKKILQMKVFSKIKEKLDRKGKMSVAEVIRELNREGVKGKPTEEELRYIIMWGTYANLFDYDHERQLLKRL